MRRTSALLVALLVTIVAPHLRATPPTAILVELFTSEGCSSCPPADTLLEQLVSAQPVAGVRVVALGEHVDYWDGLGWKDRFSSAELTHRQEIYRARFNTESIYTPQMIVDGRAEVVGSDASAARRAIERALARPHGTVRVVIEPAMGDRVGVSVAATELPALGRGDRADLVVAVTEDHLRSDVKRGENRGRTLTHAAVVRRMTTIGEATELPALAQASIALAPDWQRDHLTIVAFVQERRGRAILASAAVPLAGARP